LPVRLSTRRGRHAARRRAPRLVVPGVAVLAAGGTCLLVWGPPGSTTTRPAARLAVTTVVPLPPADPAAVLAAAGTVLPPLDRSEVDAARASRTRQLALAPPPPPPAPAPAYVRPVEGPLTSPFGQRWGRLHAGVDFGVPIGTPVRAVADGVVLAEAHNAGGYGTYVTVQHADGSLSIYAHLSKVLMAQGPVTAGQVLALSGNTGHSTGPHLHFELRSPTGPFDPRPWLVARGVVL
jgi:murein DD-endopeptidase MepM/ murein hydrolase activator NlpD